MNWKHFLRGLGAGIIFSAIIMIAAYMASGSYKMSDEDVIARAEQLGMVMEEKSLILSDESSNTDAEKTDDKSEVSETTVAEETVTATTQNVTTEEVTTEAVTEAATTEKTTTEKATTEKTETTTEEKIDTKYTTAEITVTSGMGSEEIAKLVQDAGIIDDYQDFDNYLNQNGYSKKLSVNTFKLNSGMTYEEIAKELTKGDQ